MTEDGVLRDRDATAESKVRAVSAILRMQKPTSDYWLGVLDYPALPSSVKMMIFRELAKMREPRAAAPLISFCSETKGGHETGDIEILEQLLRACVRSVEETDLHSALKLTRKYTWTGYGATGGSSKTFDYFGRVHIYAEQELERRWKLQYQELPLWKRLFTKKPRRPKSLG